MSRSASLRRTGERLSSRSARNEESSQKTTKTTMASRREESSARKALLRGLAPSESRSLASGESPPLPKSSAGRSLHRKSVSMTSRDQSVGAASGSSNPRRAVFKRSDTGQSNESSKWQ